MNKDEIEDLEIDLLLEAIFQRHGYDYRQYARTSLKRRLRDLLAKKGFNFYSELIPKVLYERSFLEDIVYQLSITVTAMFRDPGLYRAIRETVVPYLKTYPFTKIWDAGCATGEEVYSLAIVFKEEEIYNRATIFATDINDAALATAKTGIYSVDNVKEYTSDYLAGGGIRSFSEYYHARYDSMIMDQTLRQNITFANHNLVTDSSFGEMHLIVCRNVLIYFEKNLQNRVLRLFDDSLIHGGFLCLGSNETLSFSDIDSAYELVDKRGPVYRKRTL